MISKKWRKSSLLVEWMRACWVFSPPKRFFFVRANQLNCCTVFASHLPTILSLFQRCNYHSFVPMSFQNGSHFAVVLLIIKISFIVQFFVLSTEKEFAMELKCSMFCSEVKFAMVFFLFFPPESYQSNIKYSMEWVFV